MFEDDQDEHEDFIKALSGTDRQPDAQPPVPYADKSDWAAQQGDVQAQPQPAADTQGPRIAIDVPQVPTMPQRDMDRYRQIESDIARDSVKNDPNAPGLKVGWKDRLRAAAVAGFSSLAGDRDAVGSGVAAGNHRYNDAETARMGRLQSDQDAMKRWEQQGKDADEQYGRQLQGFSAGMSRATFLQGQQNTDRTFAADQSEKNYQHGRDATTDKRNATNDAYSHTRGDRQDAETKRWHDLENALARQKESREASQGRQQQDRDIKLRREVETNKLNQARQSQYDELENGNPKGGVLGFREQFEEIQRSAKNPMTKRPWQGTEQKDMLDALTQRNNAAKDKIEAEFAQGMQTLGVPTKPVSYSGKAAPITPPVTTPVQAPTPATSQAPPPQQPAQQQAAPATRKVNIGNGKVVDAVVVNGQWVDANTKKPLVAARR
jgi:hypothetical protein